MRQQITTPKQKYIIYTIYNIHPGNDVSTKESDKSLSDLEQLFDNVIVDKAAHKAPDSVSLLYERIISNLQSETLFLREQLKSKDIYFNGEILYLRNQFNDCLHRMQIKRGDSNFLSCVDKLNFLQKNSNSSLNMPSRELNLIEDHNELNKNVQYDIDKEKDICQKSGNFSDDKVNKNATTDKDKTDLNDSNDIIGTSYKHKSSKDNIRRKKDNPVKEKIFILGDSMIKHTKGWEMSSKICHKHNIYIRSFSGAKVRSMKDYVKPCVRGENPDHIIIHVGTTDLNSEINPERVAKSVIDNSKLHLKLDSHLPKKIIFIYFNESLLKMMKNAFYFILKAFFVLI